MSGPLVARLVSGLDPVVRQLVEQTVRLAEEQRLDVYAVGGAVRDVLLGIEHYDVDIVVEGDAIHLAELVGRRTGVKLTSHSAFGTATLKLGQARLDLATARSEVYPRPGALPIVHPGTLDSDLARRDFTVNALALKLAGPGRGSLVDHCGGEQDLTDGTIRILHDSSFRDDPTRLWRAVRYAARLAFTIEPRTMERLKQSLGYIRSVSGIRLRRELERIAEEPQAGGAVRMAGDLGLLTAFDGSLRVSPRQIDVIQEWSKSSRARNRTCVFLALLLCDLSATHAGDVIAALALTKRQAAAVRDVIRLGEMESELAAQNIRPSDFVALLRGTSTEALEALALLTNDHLIQERVRSYLASWRLMRPLLTGTEVEALGVRHGPDVGTALQALTAARLDGAVLTRQDEAAFVEGMFGIALRRVASG